MDQSLFDLVYRAVASRDARYDGIYYTGVRTTGIVCRPSCRARTPKPDNVTFYPSLTAAIQAGFRPCKRCRPEEGGPLRPDAVLAAQADAVITAEYGERLTLNGLAERLKVSASHLHRVYKEVTGLTPAAKLDQVRLDKACGLLRHSRMPVSEIGRSVGFRGASHFAAWFHRNTGASPTEYRERFQGGTADEPEYNIPAHP
ncbi:bifunctional transcriptional activator/DNA repair enzyme AdaA [Paenibacillus rhizophilus]|uniref:Methylphosphotriester-DNA--protein-cysteine methyltransferase family protein n=1 Tax=Paenibacillus rhizophilus TaxID=1850366 RepID=A0A3N9Q091_9BACL|nr:Ada metal-binding domain-containing protein [Paenibacillus rhizophilus]RQW10886.1 methylphosphotriester-DNA--protein-cysteine methyltransferase family protein [Paenibacillus rhizophilus]